VGLIQILDAETGQKKWIDTSNRQIRKDYTNWWKKTSKELEDLFSKNGVDNVNLETGKDYVRVLINLFKKRG